ncbi:NAD kinase-like [Convolutriloba macropyga]|uniref:NAD kinase-like n=1 Tax=Convolutriloba macropyga TaxID=536237 RepID=UPI003F51F071
MSIVHCTDFYAVQLHRVEEITEPECPSLGEKQIDSRNDTNFQKSWSDDANEGSEHGGAELTTALSLPKKQKCQQIAYQKDNYIIDNNTNNNDECFNSCSTSSTATFLSWLSIKSCDSGGPNNSSGALKMLLKWNSASGHPRSVFLVKSSYDKDETQLRESFVPLANYILSKRKVLFLEESVIEQVRHILGSDIVQSDRVQSFSGSREDQEKIDLVITLGGDGTMLRSVSLFQHDSHIPVFLSFRFGTLGFLTPHVWCPNSFHAFIDKAISGQIPVQLRCRLKGQIWRCENTPNATPQLVSSRKVLNEVTIHRGLGSRVDLDVYVNDNFVTTISGDGVLVSTPSGSTAHALSAGASLVHPDIPCIMITPICVHSLSFRPIILPLNSVIKVLPADNSRYYPWVCYDGDELVQLKGDTDNVSELILIESAGGRDLVPCVCSEEPVGDWLTDLQERLYWNVSKTANSINPLLHNKLQDDPCSLSVEQQLNGHSHSRRHPSSPPSMTKSASSASLLESSLHSTSKNHSKFFNGTCENGDGEERRRNSMFVVNNKSYSILDNKIS